jgi:hypothetical protein
MQDANSDHLGVVPQEFSDDQAPLHGLRAAHEKIPLEFHRHQKVKHKQLSP